MKLQRYTRFLAALSVGGLLATGNMAVGAVDFYVAPDGDDAGTGTKAEPLATLSGARKAVRQQRAEGIDEDIVVQIAEGRYSLDKPILFGPEDSGTSKHKVVYRAAPGETPIFTGGRHLTGWKENDDGTWSTHVEAVQEGDWVFDELFVNGQRAQPARFPNNGYLRVNEIGSDRRTNFTFYEGDIPATADSKQLDLVFLHDWSMSRIPIASINFQSQKLTTSYNVGPSASHYKMGHYVEHPRYFLQGDEDFVDRPGEWFLDHETGKLTYYPREEEHPDSVTVVAPHAKSLLAVHGNSDQPVRNLHFEGLTFMHCRYPMPPKGYAAGQATGHEDRSEGGSGRVFVDAALTFEHTIQCSFQNGHLAHLGGAGLWLKEDCDHNRLVGNVIADTGGNGIMIGTGSENPDTLATGNLVANNRVRNVGRRFFGAVGIWAGIVNETHIVQNEVGPTPYTGISLGWQWDPSPTPAARNRVSYNHIHNVMQILSDGGGIYVLGWHPDSTLRGNHIHHVPQAAGRAESNGMFLDQGTKGFKIEHNVIHHTYHSPLRFHQAHENLVRLNVMTLREESLPKIRYNATEEAIITKRNNTLMPRKQWSFSKAPHRINEAGPKPKYLESLGNTQ